MSQEERSQCWSRDGRVSVLYWSTVECALLAAKGRCEAQAKLRKQKIRLQFLERFSYLRELEVDIKQWEENGGFVVTVDARDAHKLKPTWKSFKKSEICCIEDLSTRIVFGYIADDAHQEDFVRDVFHRVCQAVEGIVPTVQAIWGIEYMGSDSFLKTGFHLVVSRIFSNELPQIHDMKGGMIGILTARDIRREGYDSPE